LPISPLITGSRQFQAEVQLAYELGYRFAFYDDANYSYLKTASDEPFYHWHQPST
jgi:hypothetical protein